MNWNCVKCGLGRSNSIHKNPHRMAFHKFEAPDYQPPIESLEERVERLERQIEALSGRPD